MIAAVSVAPVRQRIGLYFSLHPDRNITSGTLVSFLKKLRRHIQKPLFIIWDRLVAHRSRRIRQFLLRKRNLRMFLLPPYAPELNPVEPFWGYLKHHTLSNYAAEDTIILSRKAGYRARCIRQRPNLLRSFLRKTPLFSCLK